MQSAIGEIKMQISKKNTTQRNPFTFPYGKITVIGDSIPKGLYLENRHIRRIGRGAVNTIAEKLGTEIENFSVFGQTLKKCCEKGLIERWLDEHAGTRDKLILSLGGNDCDYCWEEVEKDPNAPHAPNTPLPEFERLLRFVISSCKSRGTTPAFTSLPPIDSQRYFSNVICGRADGKKIMQFFRGDVTNISRHQECYNTAILKIALENGCPFFDYRSELLLRTDYLDCLSDDGIHPNQQGHDAIAQYFCRLFARNTAVM